MKRGRSRDVLGGTSCVPNSAGAAREPRTDDE